MEVRGGNGYIEEWVDPRLVRDAQIGLLWEGTSNINALDVLRAAQREGSLPVLRAHVAGLLGNGAALPEALPLFDRAAALSERAQDNPALARQAASALYHLTSARAAARSNSGRASGSAAPLPSSPATCACSTGSEPSRYAARTTSSATMLLVPSQIVPRCASRTSRASRIPRCSRSRRAPPSRRP